MASRASGVYCGVRHLAPSRLAVLLMLAAGCSSDASSDGADGGSHAYVPPPSRTSLVDHTLWRPVGAADDPFDDRPAEVTCSVTGYAAEDLGGEPTFAVAMKQCDYMTAAQPSLTDVVAGDELKVRFWHFELTSDDPEAEAHAALAFDGEQVWDVVVPIPQPSGGLVSETFIAPADYPAGTLIHYHVHNHGLNEYFLVEFSRTN